jgi:anti-sigma-K factor RskA
MIDERQEELASLYALDLLEGDERVRFETALAGNPALQSLVQEFREASAALAQTATVTPPAELRARLMTSIALERKGAAVLADKRPPPNAKLATFRTFTPWALAASFAVLGLWLAQRVSTIRGELALKETEVEIAQLGLRSTRSLFEAEQIVTQKQISDLATRLTQRQQELLEAIRLATDVTEKLAAEIETGNRKEAEVADLAQRLATAESARATLAQRLQSEGELANLKIATLASLLNNSPEALAVAIWDPAKQEGLFTVEKLPALAADQSYELWVIGEGAPVSAGVFNIAADGSGRVPFKPRAAVPAVAKFAVSRERKDGLTSHTQPAEVVMISR